MRRKNIYVILFIGMLLTACGDDFLDLSSVQDPSVDGLYSSIDGLEFGVIGLYDALQNFYEENKLPSDLEQRSDNAQRGTRPVQENQAYYIDEEIIGNGSYWKDGYNLIKNSYVLDEKLDEFLDGNLTENERTDLLAMKGEVAFLRALAYFNMVRYYGTIPMVTESLDASKLDKAYDLGLSQPGEIYNGIIIPELQFAMEHCKTKNTLKAEEKIGRASYGAAATVLGDVYMTIGDYANAKMVLQEFYDKKDQLGYSYLSLNDIFFDSRTMSESAGENTPASIFEIQWSVEDGTQYYKWLAWDARDLSGGRKVSQDMSPSPHLVYAYSFERDLNDTSQVIDHGERFTATMDTTWNRDDAGGGDYYLGVCLKYLEYDVPVERDDSWRNYVLYRLSDVTLMLAEATYMSGGGLPMAEALVNEVRNARGITEDFNIDFWMRVQDPTALKPWVLSTNQRSEEEAFVYGILHERRLEFAFENKRYYDLKRYDKLLEFIKAKILTGDTSRDEDEVDRTLSSGEQLFYKLPDGIVKENREKYTQN